MAEISGVNFFIVFVKLGLKFKTMFSLATETLIEQDHSVFFWISIFLGRTCYVPTANNICVNFRACESSLVDYMEENK